MTSTNHEPHLTDDEGRRQRRLLDVVERTTQTGSWEIVPSQGQLFWSDNLYRIYGVAPGEVQPSFEHILAQTELADRQRLNDAIAAVVERGETQSVDYRIVRPEGEQRHLRATLEIVQQRDGSPDLIVGVVQDRTARHRAESEIAAHVAVEEALADWEALEPGACDLLTRLAGALDCVAGVFWVPRDDILVARVVWHSNGSESPFKKEMRASAPRRGSGLPGRAWRDGEPLIWTLDRAACGDRAGAASGSDELRGGIAIPALDGANVLAIVELRTDREIRVSERLRRSLHGIGHELGHYLARRGAELTGSPLTPRETEVLQIAAQGMSGRETAALLMISNGTVKTHLTHIYRKLDASDKAAAVAIALRLGIID